MRTISWSVQVGLCALCIACGTPGAGTDAGAGDAGRGADSGVPDSGAADSGAADSGAADAASCADSGPTARVDCSNGACAPLDIVGDAPDASAFQFGPADPAVFHDPAVSNRSWLAYSWTQARPEPNPDGGAGIDVYTVENHLAQSTDDGATWSAVTNLWPTTLVTDPVSGHQGYSNSESCSIIGVQDGGTTTWFGVHMRFFLKPQPGYNPDINSFTFHVTSASGATPAALATSPEAVLGDAHTAAGWNVTLRLNSLSADLGDCLLWNNPGLFFTQGKLYLLAECMAFTGSGARDPVKSRISMFSTAAVGAPATWTWSYAGTLADQTLAASLDAGLLQQPNVVTAADGTLLAIFSPSNVTPSGLLNNGCAVFPMTQLDPPLYQRDCGGAPIVRARMEGPALAGSCTYDSAVTTGVIFTLNPGSGRYSLSGSPLRP